MCYLQTKMKSLILDFHKASNQLQCSVNETKKQNEQKMMCANRQLNFIWLCSVLVLCSHAHCLETLTTFRFSNAGMG